MMIQGVSISEMINQSVTVLTKPGIATFEQYERRGGQREGLIYVASAAAVSGIIALLVGVITTGVVGGIISGLAAVILPVVGYFLSATLIHVIGTSQGGTGTKDEVFYSVSLFLAPILAVNGAIGNIPFLACIAFPAIIALGIYQIYLGYLAIRASMNLDQNKAIITMFVSWIVQVIALSILGGIFAGILVAVGAVPSVAIPPTP
jgi:Yip1 domain